MVSGGRPSKRSARARGPGTASQVSARPGDGSLSRTDALKDERVRRWDVVTPSATVIGRATGPDQEVGERIRRLHDEQHPAMRGHSGRMHRLDKARLTQAYCNTLNLTRWERDRALGIMTELDLTTFGQHRSISKVALVVIQYVVDDERRRQLGLHDTEWVRSLSETKLESLYERYESLKDDPRYRDLMTAEGLDKTSVNRLSRTLQEQLAREELRGRVLGHSPYRDPHLPAVRDRQESDGKE